MQVVTFRNDLVLGEHYYLHHISKAQDVNSPKEHELYVCCDALDKMQGDTIACEVAYGHPQPWSLHDMDAIPDTCTLLIVNGLGTGIGDALMGSIAIKCLQEHMSECGKQLIIDMLTRENRYKPYSEIFRVNPHIRRVYSGIMPYYEYRRYDYVLQNEGVAMMPGFDVLNMTDFWLNRLGLDYEHISDKRPIFYASEYAIKDVRQFRKTFTTDRPICVLNLFTTPIRAIPETKYDEFISALSEVFCVALIAGPDNRDTCKELCEQYKLLDLSDVCGQGIDYLYATIKVIADFVVTPDTSTLHLAAAAQKPTIAIFTTINPELRTRYYPTVKSIWHPLWHRSSFVGKHNADADNGEYRLIWEHFDARRELYQCLQ